jgi:hypothetical protein
MTIRNFILTTIFTISVGLLNSCDSKPKLISSLSDLDSTIKPTKISIENLAKNYKIYQGKYIETTGQFFQAFEEFAIYTPKPFFGVRKGFWLESDMDLAYDSLFFAKANGSKVTIKGIVDTTRKGHLSMYLGTIRRIYFWEKH